MATTLAHATAGARPGIGPLRAPSGRDRGTVHVVPCRFREGSARAGVGTAEQPHNLVARACASVRNLHLNGRPPLARRCAASAISPSLTLALTGYTETPDTVGPESGAISYGNVSAGRHRPGMSDEASGSALPTGTTALLWDLDNVAPPRQQLASFAAALCGVLEPDEPVIAAAHRATYRSCLDVLAALGIEVLSGGRRRNGADRVLIDQARALNERGVERFIVASNDYRFARIASLGELHVLTLSGGSVSQRLREAASSVTLLTGGDRGWSSDPLGSSGPLSLQPAWRRRTVTPSA